MKIRHLTWTLYKHIVSLHTTTMLKFAFFLKKKRLGDVSLEASCLRKIALVHASHGDMLTALRFISEAAELCIAEEDQSGAASARSLVAHMFVFVHVYVCSVPTALRLIWKAVVFCSAEADASDAASARSLVVVVAYLCVFIHTHIYIYTYIYIHIFTCIYVFIRIHKSIHICIYIYKYIYIYTFICIYMYMYTCVNLLYTQVYSCGYEV